MKTNSTHDNFDQYADGGWAAMQKLLDEQMPVTATTTSRRKRFAALWLMVGLLLGVVATLIWTQWERLATPAPTDGATVVADADTYERTALPPTEDAARSTVAPASEGRSNLKEPPVSYPNSKVSEVSRMSPSLHLPESSDIISSLPRITAMPSSVDGMSTIALAAMVDHTSDSRVLMLEANPPLASLAKRTFWLQTTDPATLEVGSSATPSTRPRAGWNLEVFAQSLHTGHRNQMPQDALRFEGLRIGGELSRSLSLYGPNPASRWRFRVGLAYRQQDTNVLLLDEDELENIAVNNNIVLETSGRLRNGKGNANETEIVQNLDPADNLLSATYQTQSLDYVDFHSGISYRLAPRWHVEFAVGVGALARVNEQQVPTFFNNTADAATGPTTSALLPEGVAPRSSNFRRFDVFATGQLSYRMHPRWSLTAGYRTHPQSFVKTVRYGDRQLLSNSSFTLGAHYRFCNP